MVIFGLNFFNDYELLSQYELENDISVHLNVIEVHWIFLAVYVLFIIRIKWSSNQVNLELIGKLMSTMEEKIVKCSSSVEIVGPKHIYL